MTVNIIVGVTQLTFVLIGLEKTTCEFKNTVLQNCMAQVYPVFRAAIRYDIPRCPCVVFYAPQQESALNCLWDGDCADYEWCNTYGQCSQEFVIWMISLCINAIQVYADVVIISILEEVVEILSLQNGRIVQQLRVYWIH